MTVNELIRELNKYDGKMEVVLDASEGDFSVLEIGAVMKDEKTYGNAIVIGAIPE